MLRCMLGSVKGVKREKPKGEGEFRNFLNCPSNVGKCETCGEWHSSGSCDCFCTRPTIIKLDGVVPGGQGKTWLNSDVNDQNSNMEIEKETLTVGDGNPNLVDHNGGPIKSSDVANNVVESNEAVQSKHVAVATTKEVAQEAARRQMPMYQRAHIDCFIQGVDATPIVDFSL